MSISIIIRAFNEDKHIGKLLSGIVEQNISAEIILVDSGSTDATVPIATHFPVKVISIKPQEFSFGRALNLGCAHASGDILVFASAHVYPVYKDWLAELIHPFKDEKVALSYGRQIGNEETKFSERQVFKKWFPEHSDYDQKHPFCNNANSAIRKCLWESQKFDEDLTGLEDLDWAKKIMASGHKIAYNAKAEIVHTHNETPKNILNRYRREAIAYKHIIPGHSFGLWDFARLFMANSLSDSIHALREGMLFKYFFQILMFRMMQFWGTYLGASRKSIDKSLVRRFYYPNSLKTNDENKPELREAIDYGSAMTHSQ